MQELINRAKELLADGTVARVLGWKAGDLPYNPEPAYFETEESLKDFVYNGFCGANLSKYMIEASKLEGKTMVCLKPCDTYSFNQLLKEHRVDREKAYIVGVGCKGKLDIEKIRKMGNQGYPGNFRSRDYRRCRDIDCGYCLRRKNLCIQRCHAGTLPCM